MGETRGEIEADGKVLVLRRIHVAYKLHAAEEHRATVERVHQVHANYCPVARSIAPAIEITTSFELVA